MKFKVLTAFGFVSILAVCGAPAATVISGTGWNLDLVFNDNSETWATHDKGPAGYTWFTSNSTFASGSNGLPDGGTVTAGGVDFQLQSSLGDNAILEGTFTLTASSKYTELHFLGAHSGALGGSITLNFSDAASVSYTIGGSDFVSWGGTSQLGYNPALTNTGTSAGFSGAMSMLTFDMTNLVTDAAPGGGDYSGNTLTSITFDSSSNNLMIHGISGVAIPEPRAAMLCGLGSLLLLLRRRRYA